MNKGTYRKLWAILAAGVLTLGVVSVAMAIELKEAHQGITIGWDANGDAFAEDAEGNPVAINTEECEGEDLAAGDILIHFVQTQATAGAAGTNLLDVDFDGAPDQTGVAEDSIQGSNVDWFVATTSAGGDVTIVTANSNIEGDQLVISHICVGDEPEEETAPPSFEQSQGAETDEPSTEPSDVVETDEPSDVVETDEPSFEQSQGAETDEPSFEQSQAGETDEPSEPDTATIGGPNDVGSPADGAWLLVVALGVLLSSIVVLTPARAKAPRR
jgi:hypothetical protein